MIYAPEMVREWVSGVLRGIYQPEPNEEIWEWAERTLKIPSTENEEKSGLYWRLEDSPYVREFMAWMKRPGKGEFWIKKSSQVGITMAVLIIICWMIVHRPGNVAYAIDSIDEARKISRTRLQRWITENRLLEEINEENDSLNNLTYYFRGMTVYMLGAFSKGGWANKSIVLFILDELDKHPYIEGEGTTTELARERCKRPKNAKIIGFSTPGETGQITAEYKTGTMEEIRFPFPCCGHVQALKWDNFVFGTREFKDLAGGYDLEKVNTHAYFKCELCQGRLLDQQKRKAMLACENVPTNPKHIPAKRSMQIWDAYSNFVTFGQIALQWIHAQGDVTKIERFMRGVRGEDYEKEGRALKHQDILDCRGAYQRGTVPFIPIEIFQAIDIQGDVQKAVKVAVDSRGSLYVVDWYTSLVLSEAVEWALEPVIGPDGTEHFVNAGLIDEGHRKKDVREICFDTLMDFAALGRTGFYPVKGAASSQVREVIGTSLQWVSGDDEILLYRIAEDQFKWQLLKLIGEHSKHTRTKKGEPVPAGLIYFPEDCDDDADFVSELCNERPVMKKNAFGREKWEWEKLGPNDFWDCVKYCLAVWMIRRPELVKAGLCR